MDRQTLNLIAAVLCGVGSLATLLEARSMRSIASGLFGVAGSTAWAASAYREYAERHEVGAAA